MHRDRTRLTRLTTLRLYVQIYRAQYAVAVEEMCERGTTEWSLAADRRLCHTCRIVRPLRSKVRL
eukprot:COSAG02_NODE_398_length_23118_cov_49.968939_14_plen_65_part_00